MVHLFTLWSSSSHQVTLANLHGFCIIWHVDWVRVPVVVCTRILIWPILCILLSTENRFIQNFRYFPYVPDDYFVHLEGQELYTVEPIALVKRSLWRVLSKAVTWLDVNFWTLAQVYQGEVHWEGLTAGRPGERIWYVVQVRNHQAFQEEC